MTDRWTAPAELRVGSTIPPGWSGSGSELREKDEARLEPGPVAEDSRTLRAGSPMSPRWTRQCWQM